MDIYAFIKLFGGLAFFLFGMNLMSTSLEKMTGGKLEKLLKKVTDNKLVGMLVGIVITIAIQSSSAMTVMLVGFVNSGIMELEQTVGVIFGSDIGTTLTAWILSMSGIESDGNIILGLLKPANFSLIFAVVGIILLFAASSQKKKYLGTILLGFAVLMTGMTMMSDSMSPLADSDKFQSILTAFSNPVLGVLIGTVITGIIQSSAASIGMIQSLSITGQITYGMAIPLIMGANIGTCMTAILSSIGVNRNAKRVAAIHVSIKIISTFFWLIVFYGLDAILNFAFMDATINPLGVALAHTIFNLLTVALLFPFSKYVVMLSRKLIKDAPEDQELFLDERLMATPSIAVGECQTSMKKMVKKAVKCLDNAMDLIKDGFDGEKYKSIVKNEDKIDGYEDHLGAYIMKLSTTASLSEEDKKQASTILQSIGEFERMTDHAAMIAKSIEEKTDNRMEFSKEAYEELDNLIPAVRELYTITAESYKKSNPSLARKVEPLSDVIESICERIRASQVERLTDGKCSVELGYIYSDILTSLTRISAHCLNIAAVIIRMSEVSDRNNGYMHDIKHRHDEENDRLYQLYRDKYMPEYMKDKEN